MSVKRYAKLICQCATDIRNGESMKKTMTIVLWNCSNGLGRLNSYFSHEQDINFGKGSPVYLTR